MAKQKRPKFLIEDSFKKLESVPCDFIYQSIKAEHPQMVASFLACLPSHKSAQLLAFFSSEQQVDLMLRMANINPLLIETSEFLSALAQNIFLNFSAFSLDKKGGVEAVVKLLKTMDAETQKQLIDSFKTKDPKLYSLLKALI